MSPEGLQPLSDPCDFDRIHLDAIVGDDHAKVFDPGLLKITFLRLEVKVVFVHAFKDKAGDMTMFL